MRHKEGLGSGMTRVDFPVHPGLDICGLGGLSVCLPQGQGPDPVRCPITPAHLKVRVTPVRATSPCQEKQRPTGEWALDEDQSSGRVTLGKFHNPLELCFLIWGGETLKASLQLLSQG